MTDDFRGLRQLLDEIEQHPGTQASRAWDSLRRIHSVLLGNQAELTALLDTLERNEGGLAVEVIQNVRRSQVQEAFGNEMTRRLHNYVASVKTLVDHTRNLMRQYHGTPAGLEYDQRVKDLVDAPIVPLMQKLRDYFLHYKIPPYGVQMSFDNGTGTETFSCFLNRPKALDFSDWPAAARRYLEEHNDDRISLQAIVLEYADAIESLYRWLYAQFEVLHSDDIDAVNKLIARTPGARRSDGTPI